MKAYLLWILVGYLSGSVLYAYWIPKKILGIDIREHTKDSNPGTANAFMNAGVGWGSLILLCELLKGLLPVWLAIYALGLHSVENASWLFVLVVAAPVIGHAFPFFGRTIHGGKGIAVSFGVLMGLWRLNVWQPAWVLAFFYIFYSVAVVVKPHRVRSVVTYVSFLVLSVFLKLNIKILAAEGMIATVVIVKHVWRGNFLPHRR